MSDALLRTASWWFAAALVTTCLIVASGLTSTADTRVFLGDSGQAVQDLIDFEEEFGRRSTLYFAVYEEGAAKAKSIPSDLLLNLEAKIWAVESVTSVVSVVSSNHIFRSSDGVGLVPIHLLTSKEQKKQSLEKPNSRDILVSRDKTWWSIAVELDLPVGLPGKVVELNKEMEKLADEMVSIYPGSVVEFTGELALMSEFAKSAERDSGLLVPVALLVILGIFSLSIKSWRVTLVLFALLAMSISLALALRATFGAPTNTATATIPLIILIVVAANAMHFFWAILYRSNQQYSDTTALVRDVRNKYAIPLSISGFSTAGGFFLLMLATSPPFFELGWVVGVVVTASTLLLLLWAPSALACFPIRKLGSSSHFVSRLASSLFLFGRSFSVFRIFVGLALFSLMGLFFVSINDDFTSYFPEHSSFGRATTIVEDKFGGPDYLEVVQADSADSGGIERLLRKSSKLAEWLRARPEVASVVALSDTLTEISNAMEDEDSPSVEELLLVYEMGMPDGHSLADRITDDRASVRTTALLGKIDSAGILELKSRIEKAWPDGTLVTGVSVPTSQMARRNTIDVFIGVLFAGLFVSLVVYAIHRSVRVAALVLGFVLLPLGIGFGVWGWIFSDVGLATAAILAASVGIVVDDVVHVVYRYVSVWSGQINQSEASIVQVMKEVAPPILISSVAVAAGFGVLVVSDFGVNSTLGFSVSIIVLSALLTVLLLLPRPLTWILSRST